MKKLIAGFAVAALAALPNLVHAQTQGAGSAAGTSQTLRPVPVVVTYETQPAATQGQPCGQPCCQTCCQPCCVPCGPDFICVREVKKNTKVVYRCGCKDICLWNCDCCSFFKKCFGGDDCGCNSCEPCECGTPKTVKVLYKKVVPDCDTYTCVPKKLCDVNAAKPAAK